MRNFTPGLRIDVHLRNTKRNKFYMKTKFLGCLLLLFALFNSVSIASAAETNIASGTVSTKKGTYVTTTPTSDATSLATSTTSSASISWVIDKDGVLTISPLTYATVKVDKVDTQVCPMPNFSTTDMAPWYKYASQITKIVISEGLTSIGEYAFYSSPAAYAKCTTVNFPSTLEYIGSYAFHNTRISGNVVIPDNVYYIGNRAFYQESNCANIKSLKLPANLKVLGERCIYRNTGITSLTIQSPYIDRRDISGSNCLQFYYLSALTSVSLPSTTKTIPARAFEHCTALTSFDIPVGVSNIGLTESSTVYYNPLGNCSSIKNITIGGSEDGHTTDNKYKVVDGVLYTGDGKTLICYPAGSDRTSFVIPADVENIAALAFYGASKLTSITVATKPVTEGSEIKMSALSKIEYSAFYNCTGLTSLDFSETVLQSVGTESFISCTKLGKVIFPSTMKTINGAAFSNTGTKAPGGLDVSISASKNFSIVDNVIYQIDENGEPITLCLVLSSYDKDSYVLPPTVSTIRRDAFYKNTCIKNIDLSQGGSNKLTTIEYRAFRNCEGVEELIFPDCITSFNGDACMSCMSLKRVKLPKNSKVTTISYGFYNCQKLERIEIPNNITGFGSHTFYQCYALKEVAFESTKNSLLTTIGDNCFYNCTNLESITFPDKFTTMGYQAFKGCSKLKYIKFKDKMKSFGFQTFFGCSALETIVINSDVPPVIQSDSFDGSLQNKTPRCKVIVPCSVKNKYEQANYYTDIFDIESDFDEQPIGSITVQVADECDGMGRVYVHDGRELSCDNIIGGVNPIIEAVANEGFVFDHWIDLSNNFMTNDIIHQDDRLSWTEDVVWEAYFEHALYEISKIEPQNGKFDFVNNSAAERCEADPDCEEVVNTWGRMNDVITVSVLPNIGYEIDALSVVRGDKGSAVTSNKLENGDYSFVMPSSDVTIDATFKKSVYKITINSGAGGSAKAVYVGGSSELTSANYFDNIEIKATPDEDYQVSSISAKDAGGNDVAIDELLRFRMPNSDVAINISFLPINYRVDVGGKFVVGDFEYTVTSLEPDKVSIAAKDYVAGNLLIPESGKVTYNKITYDIVSLTKNGFMAEKGGASSVTFPNVTPLPTNGESIFDSNILLKVPCGLKNTYVEAGYGKAGNSIESITQYEYSVSAITDGHGSAVVVKQPDCDDHSATLKAEPNEGYSFDKWDTGATSPTLTLPNVVENKTVKALFKANHYKVNIGAHENGSLATNKTGGIIGEEITVVTAAPSAGYRLQSIDVKDAKNNVVEYNNTTKKFIMPASDVTVSATFVAVDYEIVVANVTNGTVDVQKTAKMGNLVKPTITPEPGYSIDKVTVVGDDKTSVATNSSDGYSFSMPAQKVTITVTFKKNKYKVTINTPQNGTASLSTKEAYIGDEVSVTTTPNSSAGANYVLESIIATYDNGTKNVTVTDGKFKMPAGDVSVTVMFGEAGAFVVGNTFVIGNLKYTVTKVDPTFEVSVEANGTLSGVEEVELLDNVTYLGQSFSVVNVKTSGFTNCADLKVVSSMLDNPIKVEGTAFKSGLTLNVPCNTTAKYMSLGYSNFIISEIYTGPRLTVMSSDVNLGSAVVTRQQDCNANAIAKAQPNIGCIFVKWSDGSLSPDYQLSLESDLSLTATFEKAIYEINVSTNNSAYGAVSTKKSNVVVTSANYKDVIYVDCVPSAGYQLESVNVTYKIGDDIVSIPYSDGKFEMPAANASVDVKFKPIEYKITVAPAEGGKINVASSGTVGQRISVTALPNEGYEIDQALSVKYNTNEIAEISNGQFTMPAADVFVSGTFKKKTYTISLAEGIVNGEVTLSRTTAQIGDEVTVITTPIEGYDISSVRMSDGTIISNGKFIMPAKNVVIEAIFVAKTFNISVNIVGGGSVSVPDKASYGSTVSITNIAPSAGYEFVSIKTDKASVTLADDKKSASFTMPASDVVVTPEFKKVAYGITINTAEGGTVTSVPTATYGDDVTLNINPTDGWQIKTLECEGVSIALSPDKQTASFTMPDKSVTITPVFEKISYNIVVGNVSNGTLTVVGNKTSAHVGDEIEVSYFPASGYHFTAFTVNDENYALSSDNKFVMPAKDVTISVKFSATGYSISIVDVEGGKVTANKYDDVNVNEKVTLTIDAATGYEFVDIKSTTGSISIASDKKSAILTMAADNATVTPEFKKVDYTVAFSANDGNKLDYIQKANYGDEVTVTFTPSTGYEFDNIEIPGVSTVVVAEDKSNAKFSMPASNVNGTVNFKKINYPITIFDSTNGKVTGQATATYEENVYLTISPEKGYKIKSLTPVPSSANITIAIDGLSATLKMPASEVEITAVFEAVDYTINYVNVDHGSVTGPLSANYQQLVTLNVIADKGYKLADLKTNSGSVEIAPDGHTALLTMGDKNADVTATFEAIDYSIKYNESAHGSISGKTMAHFGEQVVVNILPDVHYEIATITPADNIKIAEDKKTAVLTMDASDITLDATFTKKLYPISVYSTGPGKLVCNVSEAGYDEKVTIAVVPDLGSKLESLNVSGASYELSEDKSTIVITVEEPIVVVAGTFSESAFKISVEGDDHGKVSAPASAKYQETIEISVTPDAGYELQSMVVDGLEMILVDNNVYSYTMPNSDVVISVAFKAVDYDITIGEIVNGTLSSNKTKAQVGEEVTVQYQADEGFLFLNFYVNDDVKALSKDNKFVMPASNVVLTVEFGKEEYGIAVKDVEGGSVEPSVNKANVGDVVDLVIKPAVGYEFVSVGVEEGQKATVSDVDMQNLTAKLTMAAENATIVPVFKKSSFAISFTTNDGNVVDVAESAVFGEEVTVTFVPAKGYKFKEIKSGDIKFSVDAESASATFTMPAEDVKGTVEFDKIDYTIIYAESANGSISGASTAHYGDKVVVTVKPDDHYEIATIFPTTNVAIAEDGKTAILTMGDSDITLIATFNKKLYPISVLSNGPGKLVPNVTEAGIGESVTISINPELGGRLEDLDISGASYELSDDKSSVVITVKEPAVVVVGTFAESSFKISVEDDGHGKVSAPTSAKYQESIEISVTPDTGYELESMRINGLEIKLADNVYSYTMPNSDVVISVVFKAINYNITIGEVANGTLASDKTKAHVGEEVTVQYQAAEGFHFLSFYINGDVKSLSEDNKFVMPASDVVLTAKFSKEGYGISVRDVEGGTVIPSVYEANVGDVVDLAIVPVPGYEFVSVGVADGQRATVSDVDIQKLTAVLTMSAENVTIVPVFKKSSFVINFTANDGNIVEAPKSAVYGDNVTVNFVPAKGYKFKEIKADGAEFSVDAESSSATFTMPAGDVNGSVVFDKIDYTIVYAESANGSISGVTTAHYGDQVLVSVSPDKYHQMSDITVSSGSVEMSDDRLSAIITMDAANVIVVATFEKACDYYRYAPATSIYDWILIVDKTEFEKLGFVISDSNVTWYRVVGELDDPCDDFDVEDDVVVCQGMYLTSEKSLLGSGNYYAVVEVDGERFRTKTFVYEDNGMSKVTLAPTRASRRQTLMLRGLKDESDVMVYDMNGNLVKSLRTDGSATYQIEAEDNSGVYIVRVVSGPMHWSFKYVVK